MQNMRGNVTFNQKQKGFTLPELLVSMTIGAAMMTGVTTVYTNTLSSTAHSVSMTRLDQELQAIVQLISRETQRTGFDFDAVNGSDTDFGLLETTSSCIRYSYDVGSPANGTLEDTEKFGFAYRSSDNTVEFGTNIDSCSSGSAWTAINDPKIVTVSNMNLVINQLCTNMKDGSDCMTVAPVSGDKVVRKYQLDITLTGHPTHDDSLEKTVSTRVTLNNEVIDTIS